MSCIDLSVMDKIMEKCDRWKLLTQWVLYSNVYGNKNASHNDSQVIFAHWKCNWKSNFCK